MSVVTGQTEGGYEIARQPRQNLLPFRSQEYKALMDRRRDEIDVLAITPMLQINPPMTLAAYCEIFCSALSRKDVHYPHMSARYKALVKAFDDRRITRDQFHETPLVYYVEETSKALARILRF